MSRYDCTGRQPLPLGDEWIPAIPDIRPARSIQRDPEALLNQEPRGSLSVRYEDGELSVITFSNPLPSAGALKHLMAEERKKHLIRRLTFVFSNSLADETVPWLIARKFERNEGHPLAKNNLIAWSKDYSSQVKP